MTLKKSFLYLLIFIVFPLQRGLTKKDFTENKTFLKFQNDIEEGFLKKRSFKNIFKNHIGIILTQNHSIAPSFILKIYLKKIVPLFFKHGKPQGERLFFIWANYFLRSYHYFVFFKSFQFQWNPHFKETFPYQNIFKVFKKSKNNHQCTYCKEAFLKFILYQTQKEFQSLKKEKRKDSKNKLSKKEALFLRNLEFLKSILKSKKYKTIWESFLKKVLKNIFLISPNLKLRILFILKEEILDKNKLKIIEKKIKTILLHKKISWFFVFSFMNKIKMIFKKLSFLEKKTFLKNIFYQLKNPLLEHSHSWIGFLFLKNIFLNLPIDLKNWFFKKFYFVLKNRSNQMDYLMRFPEKKSFIEKDSLYAYVPYKKRPKRLPQETILILSFLLNQKNLFPKKTKNPIFDLLKQGRNDIDFQKLFKKDLRSGTFQTIQITESIVSHSNPESLKALEQFLTLVFQNKKKPLSLKTICFLLKNHTRWETRFGDMLSSPMFAYAKDSFDFLFISLKSLETWFFLEAFSKCEKNSKKKTSFLKLFQTGSVPALQKRSTYAPWQSFTIYFKKLHFIFQNQSNDRFTPPSISFQYALIFSLFLYKKLKTFPKIRNSRWFQKHKKLLFQKINELFSNWMDALPEKTQAQHLKKTLFSGSYFQTYALSLWAIALSNTKLPARKKVLSILKKMYLHLKKRHAFLRVPYTPSHPFSSPRAASARAPLFYLALLKNAKNDREKKEFSKKLYQSFFQYKKYFIYLLIHHLRTEGTHLGTAHLAPYYFLPTFPWIGKGFSVLKKSAFLTKEEKQSLIETSNFFLSTLKRFQKEDGFFKNMGSGLEIDTNPKNMQPFWGLGILFLL